MYDCGIHTDEKITMLFDTIVAEMCLYQNYPQAHAKTSFKEFAHSYLYQKIMKLFNTKENK